MFSKWQLLSWNKGGGMAFGVLHFSLKWTLLFLLGGRHLCAHDNHVFISLYLYFSCDCAFDLNRTEHSYIKKKHCCLSLSLSIPLSLFQLQNTSLEFVSRLLCLKHLHSGHKVKWFSHWVFDLEHMRNVSWKWRIPECLWVFEKDRLVSDNADWA